MLQVCILLFKIKKKLDWKKCLFSFPFFSINQYEKNSKIDLNKDRIYIINQNCLSNL